jgi:cyclophilin family peptidyl-prolyl cis-trans isomerase
MFAPCHWKGSLQSHRTLALQFLDGKHTVFGEVVEGIETTLKAMNELYVDTDGRPYR